MYRFRKLMQTRVMPAETRSGGNPSKRRMAPRPALFLILVALADFPCAAQLGSPYPGQYPGGGYPGGGYPGGPYPGGGYPGGGYPGNGGGIPMPGRNKNGPKQASDTLTGKLQRISTSQLVVANDDGTQTTVSVEKSTKYFTPSGAAAKFGDFDTGDLVTIDASRDNQNYYHAVRMTLQQKATTADQKSGPQSTESSGSSGDSDRPELKRNSSSRDSTAGSDTPASDDPDRPRLKRNSSSTDSASARTDSASAGSTDGAKSADAARKPAPRDADDPGPPVLRRGAPPRIDSTRPAGSEESQTVASARPSIKAEDSNGVTHAPPPPVVGPASPAEGGAVSAGATSRQTSGDPVIQGAREAASNFTETLPSYLVKQYTTRYQTDMAHGNRTSWQALDVVTADVVCENGKESYRNILINGKPSHGDIEKTGSWSTGEFVTILQDILAPQTDADFHGKRSTTIANRAAFRYDYSVEKPNSHWHVIASAESYLPGYTGSIWIDKENFRVLRIEMSARDMPRSFPLDTVESAVDYDYTMIGDRKFLLPSHSEALSCERGTGNCSRNVIEFRNYRKFSADTSITFEPDKN
jgi:hypothetical protein